MADEVTNVLIQLQLKNAAQVKAGLDSVKAEIGSLSDAASEAHLPFDEITTSIKRLKSEAKGTSTSVEGLRRTGGALSQIGLGAIGAPISQVGDIAQVVKEFQNLRKALPELASGAIQAAGGIGPLIGGIVTIAAPAIALTLAFKALTDAIAAQKKLVDDTVAALKSDTDTRLQDIEAIHNASSQQIKDSIEVQKLKLAEIQTEKAARQAFLDDIQRQYAELGSSFDPAKRAALGEAGQAAQQSLDDLTKREEELTGSIKRNTDSILPNIEARERETKIIQLQDAGLEQQIDLRTKEAGLIRSGSSQAIQSRIDALLDENIAIVDVINSGKASKDELTKLGDRLGKNNAELQSLQVNVLDVVRAREKEEQALKDLAAQQEKVVGVYEKYQDDIKSISEKYNEDAANLEQKRVDKLAEIQQQALDDAQKLLTDLQNREADLRTNLDRELSAQSQAAQQQQLQDQIAFQRNEVKEEQKHQDEIERIRREARANEYELSLSRDFAGLARSRRQTANQIAEVNRQANQERQQRLEEYRQRVSDEQAAFIAQRAQAIAKYQQDIADAQLQYRREYLLAAQNRNRALAAAQNEYQQQYAQLRINLTRQLQMRYDAARAEIQLVQQTSAIRKQTFDAEYLRAQQIFNLVSGASGGFTSSIRGRAFGGSLSAGMSSYVNEPGHGGERFRTGGKSIALPGYGLFTPLKSGTVEQGGTAQNITVSPTFNISGTGATPERVAAIVNDKLETTIKRIFVNKAG